MVADNLKVLQISQKNLSAPLDGGKIAMRAMAAGLRNAGCVVDQWVLDTPRQPLQNDENTAFPDTLYSGKLDTRIKAFDALKNFIFSSASYNIERFRSEVLANEIAELVRKNAYDLVQVESIFAFALIESALKKIEVPIILRAHNAEHVIWERMAGGTNNPIIAFYLGKMSKRLKNDERTILSRIDGLIAISDTDLTLFRSLGYSGKAVVAGIPAMRIAQPNELAPTDSNQLFHLGSMDWLPNREGVEWFLHEIWPKLSARFPNLSLSLAGKSMPDAVLKKAGGNLNIEQVDNAERFMLSHGMMVVPLRSGGGIRAKIIEGMAIGRIILSTSIGAEGIPVKDREHLFICDTAEDFIDVISYLQKHPESLERVSKNACTFAKENFSLETITKPVIDLYYELLHQ